MTAALPLSCADRVDASAAAPGRTGQAAPQSGPSFAAMLQHGQATHAPLARAAKPPPAQTDAAPPEASAGEHPDKPAEAIAPDTPGKAFNAAARPSARARERAPVFASATPDLQAPPSAEDPPRDADATRHAADEPRAADPHAMPPIADLQEWMASLKPLHTLPMPTDRVAAQAPAVPGEGGLAPAAATRPDAHPWAQRPAAPVHMTATAPSGPAVEAGTLVSTSGATAESSAQTLAAHRPGVDSAPLAPAATAALARPPEGPALRQPADAAAALNPAMAAAPPRPTEGSAQVTPIATAALPNSAETQSLLRPAEGAAPPAFGLARGLHRQRGATDGDDTRRPDSNGVAALNGAPAAGLMPALAALASAERRPAAPDLPAVRDFVQGLVGSATGAVPRGPDAAAPTPITLPAALHAPDFAQVLGAQVSVLARDGVQHAELRLHPAEMGPITVHIHIDDKDARVDFHANVAATREVIERGLPELATALREQGLTLAGGGVFQQAPDPRGQADREAAFAGGLPRRHLAAPDAAPVRAVTLPVPQGTLDVYA